MEERKSKSENMTKVKSSQKNKWKLQKCRENVKIKVDEKEKQ